MIDLKLDDWPERELADGVGLRPISGVALAAVLREHSEQLRAAPTAFALYSGELKDISPNFPPTKREHAIARANNLEWVFPKKAAKGGVALSTRVEALALAVMRLPRSWPELAGDKGKTARELLGFDPKVAWASDAWFAVEECHPPLHELSRESHGLAFLRWLAQRVLPYPCFLWDEQSLALRLFTTPASLRKALNQSTNFVRALDPLSYRGILSSFDGRRWWRSGVESFLWDITAGAPFDPDLIHAVINRRYKVQLSKIPSQDAVICIDSDFTTTDDFAPISEAVRVQPDDWPPYADQAWTRTRLAAEEPSLETIVVAADRKRVLAWKSAHSPGAK
ncbi:MAG: hypothetical protein M3P30_16415 [Chloroflexota bacterium]|nr:hypothetical protein [Chloroflexota bacterium]